MAQAPLRETEVKHKLPLQQTGSCLNVISLLPEHILSSVPFAIFTLYQMGEENSECKRFTFPISAFL